MAELFATPDPSSIINLLQLINEYVPNAWNILTFVIWIVIFSVSRTASLAQNVAMTFFITSILSFLLFVMGLINETVVIALIIGTALSTVWLFFQGGN